MLRYVGDLAERGSTVIAITSGLEGVELLADHARYICILGGDVLKV
jgi:predicted short-subunit dehydrogenase-like oxidoreductase (DUF2520 family)